jgi:hypothetical protein
VSQLSRLQWWRRVSARETREHLIDDAHPGRTLCARVTLVSGQRWAQVREAEYQCRDCVARRGKIAAILGARR